MSWSTNFRAVLSSRNPLLLISASTLSSYGDWFFLIALSGLMLELGGGEGLTASRMLPYIAGFLFAPIGGLLSDRLPRRSVMIGADVLRGVGMFLLVAIAARGGPLVGALSVLVMGAMAGTTFRAARMSLLPGTVKKEELLALNALDGGIGSSAVVLGPALGALLFAGGMSRETLFAFNGATFLVSALLLLFVKVEAAPVEAPATPKARPSRGQMWRDGIGAIASSRSLLWANLLNWLSHVASGAMFILLPLLATRVMQGGDAAIGSVTAATGLGFILGMLTAGIIGRHDKRYTASLGILCYGVVLGLAGHAPDGASILAAAFAMGLCGSIAEAPLMTLIQQESADEVRGRVFATVDALGILGLLVGSTVFGLLSSRLGVTASALVVATPVALGALACLGTRVLSAPRQVPLPALATDKEQ